MKTRNSFPGASFYFSDNPFGNNHDGAKTNFRSNGFIYGPNQAIEDAFNVSPMGKSYYLLFNFDVIKRGEGRYAQTMHNSVMLSPEDLKKQSFNFDLLPDPAKASTGIGMNYDRGFDAGHIIGGPMYPIIKQENFPDNGHHTTKPETHPPPPDSWGNRLTNHSDCPAAMGEFQYNFNTNDIATIQKNFTAATQTVRSAIFTLQSLPEWWPAISGKLADLSLTPAEPEAITKAELSSRGEEKLRIANERLNTIGYVQKNNLGLPEYQQFAESIYTLFKSQCK
ncbi:MAG: hypothetical protein JST09_07880 [Bacteroidetes bacterium]|nr:hypothetical protein [Bacteroidota bacterium]MBS1608961.1 hypothetical protein [Bacteroidota bacterium]